MSQILSNPPKFFETENLKLPIPHYLTFPTAPPKSRGQPPASPTRSFIPDSNAESNYDEDWDSNIQSSPLPIWQLAMLAVISLAEQTAFNSISPYLPEMVSTFPGVNPKKKGLVVGTIASSFAIAQIATSFFWGWLSDQIGRKPVIMFGTISTGACFLAFGFCKSLWQAMLIQILMGLLNGNQAIISTCLGEMTDKSNQSRAFVYLPVLYGVGAITGPALGGLSILEKNPFKKDQENYYPFLLPNLISAIILVIAFTLTACFLEESLDGSRNLSPMKKKMTKISSFLWKPKFCSKIFSRDSCHSDTSENRNVFDTRTNETADQTESRSLLSVSAFLTRSNSQLTKNQIGQQAFSRNTLVLLTNYLFFQLSNVSFNSLYPIFVSEPVPNGLNFSAKEIGFSLSLSNLVGVVFQVAFFGNLKQKMGNKATYQTGLFFLFVSMMIMPWISRGYKPMFSKWGARGVWLWIELGFVLFFKTVASVGGLTSVLLLITNSAPSNSELGTLNGVAQTLSAAGRALGPFLAGGLFSVTTSKIHNRGEALAWSVFGLIALLSFLSSFFIKGSKLESEEWIEENLNSEAEGE